jgi:2',3'-cyclic-nucleotide 2'-phosphodiesterase/3'-nucleotidase
MSSARHPSSRAGQTTRLTILGTADLHGAVLNWDYFKDTEYDDDAGNDVGLAKLSTLITAVREERGRSSTLTIDAGDTIQGTPLTYYYAKIDPISGGTGASSPVHPMAEAMNAIGYDAAAIGNHEFNYGVELLRGFESQLHHPLLGGNVLDWDTGEAAFTEFVIKTVSAGEPVDDGHRHGEPVDDGDRDRHGADPARYVRVGIVGLVTPGCAIWDRASLEGRLRFDGIVESARRIVPEVKRAGADVVIIACHSGATTSSSYGDALPWPENASTLLAQQVAGIDAILVGHAHVEIAQRFVTGPDGTKQVLLSEPLKWGMRLTVMDLDLASDEDGRWRVTSSQATVLNANTAAEDPKIAGLIRTAHEQTRSYVNGVIGSSSAAMSAATARFEHTAAIGFINHVQAEAVSKALAGTSSADLPVLAVAAPFNSVAGIPAGQVTVRDVAGLYSYDNTLQAIRFAGAQVRAYLEFSANYFKQISGTGPFKPAELTNAPTATAPSGTPDYNYDVMGGLGTSPETALSYDIDIAQVPGSRIKNLTYGGAPMADSQQFIVAINNYRASGGGNFPGVTSAPVIYDAQLEVRQLILDRVGEARQIDPSVFSRIGWRLVSDGLPITVIGSAHDRSD